MTFLPGLVLAAAGVLDYGTRSELRLRGGGDIPVLDVEATPAARLSVRSHTWEVTAGYAPRLTLRQVDLRASFEALHGATFAATLRGRRTTLSVQTSGTYGTESFSSLAFRASSPSGSPQPERLPETARITYAALRAGATVSHAASRRWLLRATFEYLLSGGADEAAREIVPLQLGPHAQFGAEFAPTRKDRFVSALDASQVAFSTGSEAVVLEASEAWRRALSRRAESTLRVGVAGAMFAAGDADPPSYQAYPVAEAALVYRLPADRVEMRAAVWIAPVVDRLNGRVDERLQGTLGGTWNFAPSFSLRGHIGGAASVPWTGDQAIRLALGDVALSARLTERVRLDVGTRGALQSPQGASQWVFFAAATFEAQPLRF